MIIDEGGVIEAIIALERNVAHRLIEEFMLLANETVASFLEAQAAPSLYRVHEEPDLLKVERFEEFIAGFGYSLGAPATAVGPKHFQKLLERIHGKPEEKPIAFLMLRTMQKARYAPENLGHFGLAAASYTHFTSPIRRYPDLVVHRALRAVRHGLLERGVAGGVGGGAARDGAAHLGDGAARRRCRARAAAVEESEVHGRQGRRGIRRLRDRRRRVRPVRPAHRALRRRAGPRVDDGRRLLPVPRRRAHAARREHAEGLPPRRQGRRCR